jgi:sporulation protein YlmC with PRC-barrel domain
VVIGEITKLFLTPDCRIDALEVKLRKATAERLRTRHSLLHPATIEIPAQSIQSIGDTVIMSAAFEDLRAPEPAPARAEGEPAPARPTRTETLTSPAPTPTRR